MSIKGITNLSLVDWDGVACATIFIGDCNFRCPWCQNASLVLPQKHIKIGTIYPKSLFQHIEGLGKYIDGICITGGEPTMNRSIKVLIDGLKERNYKVKLDTNGSFPWILATVRKVVDYIAMDIKAPLTIEKYSKACGKKFTLDELTDISESISLIMKCFKDYEFRTTVVPGLHTVKDIEQIAKYAIKDAKKYVIQNFWSGGELINPHYKAVPSFGALELDEFIEAAKPYVKEVKLRDIIQKA